MLRLAQKAFYPGKDSVSAAAHRHQLQISRDDRVSRLVREAVGVELIVHKNQKALDEGANPFSLGTQKCCGLLKTRSLLDASRRRRIRRRIRRSAPRRRKIARQGARLFVPRFARPVGPEESAARAVEHLQQPPSQGRKHSRVSALELDGAGRLALHPRGKDSHRAALFRQGARSRRARRVDSAASSRRARCFRAKRRRW